jgi:hypothetical protein
MRQNRNALDPYQPVNLNYGRIRFRRIVINILVRYQYLRQNDVGRAIV